MVGESNKEKQHMLSNCGVSKQKRRYSFPNSEGSKSIQKYLWEMADAIVYGFLKTQLVHIRHADALIELCW